MSDDFALYIHWPFCESKCPYCDFNSHVRETVDQARWRAAYLQELSHFAAETRGRTLTSIFFGGGTPSLMEPATAAGVIEAAAGHWAFAPDIEITLEANPSSVETSRFEAFKSAGVNRVSIGVQALNDDDLQFLGRRHNHEEALNAIEAAAKTFARYSFDLIYARPGQTVDAWRRELKDALRLTGSHLSVYQLTIEPGTAFHRERIEAADEDTGAGLYEITQEILEAFNLPAYEISNHAKPGEESRHNLTYWRSGEWLGVGPGAHGRLRKNNTAEAVVQIRPPESWLTAVETKGHGTVKRTALAPEDAQREAVMMGLRLREGISRKDFQTQFGCALDACLDTDALKTLIEGGYVENDENVLRATAMGRQCLNAVLAKLIA
ncbi:MAG: radical SAM family heme chaperone HemW [Rhodospirillales bacterium]